MNETDRITKLETSVTHLAKLMDDLNDVVTKQNHDLFNQKRTIQRLKDELKSLKEQPTTAESFSLEDEKPPHY